MQGSDNTAKVDPEFLFVLLGASNLARGYSALTRHLTKNISHSQFINALGPGRGYCARGGLFNFSYLPIGQCRVMKSAESHARQGARIAILFSDIGNDIMYGVPADSLIECLDSLIEKSLSINAEVFLTSIHVDVSRDMSKTAFKLLKALFYPNSPVTFDHADSAVKSVNHYIQNKANENERVHTVSGLGPFCGLDKIHFSFLKCHLAWSHIASEMLETLGISPVGRIGLSSIAVSVFENFNRLITSDMLRVTKKPKEFF